jgi:hypothetical protein
MPVFPISFSMPPEKIVASFPPKNRFLAHIIPGDLSTYIYKTEEEYYKGYQDSYFGITIKKDGWDCMRHYEILANGCIPLFFNILDLPPKTMVNFPRDIITKTNKLYFELLDKPLEDADKQRLNTHIEELFAYTRTHLTTTRAAQNILDSIGVPRAKRVLFLSGNLDADYLRCLTLSGFKNLLGAGCHDYPRVAHLYDNYTGDFVCHWGGGMTYQKTIRTADRNDEYDNTVISDIMNHTYDIVIYGSYHRGLPFIDIVSSFYKDNEIVLLCGEDCDIDKNRTYHDCPLKKYSETDINIFIREQ